MHAEGGDAVTGQRSEDVRFRVSRVSEWSDEVPPCPEAYQGTYTEHRYCTLPLSQAMKAANTEWFRRLANHRPAPGGSVADALDQPCWFVDIGSLADLEAFVGRHGHVIVDWRSDGPTIDIYDGYRE